MSIEHDAIYTSLSPAQSDAAHSRSIASAEGERGAIVHSKPDGCLYTISRRTRLN